MLQLYQAGAYMTTVPYNNVLYIKDISKLIFYIPESIHLKILGEYALKLYFYKVDNSCLSDKINNSKLNRDKLLKSAF